MLILLTYCLFTKELSETKKELETSKALIQKLGAKIPTLVKESNELNILLSQKKKEWLKAMSLDAAKLDTSIKSVLRKYESERKHRLASAKFIMCKMAQ